MSPERTDLGALWERINSTREEVISLKAEVKSVREAIDRIERRTGRVEVFIFTILIGCGIAVWKIVGQNAGIPI